VKLLAWLFYLVLGAATIWLAIANRHDVTLSLAPFDYAIDLPLIFVVFLGVLIGFIAIGPWSAWRRWRLKRRLKKAEARIATLDDALAAMTAERDRLRGLGAEARQFEAAQDAAGPRLLPADEAS
jgi:uncharacterized integral membrane protein